MPAGVAHPPGGVPLQGLVLEFGLGEPEYKVVFIALVGVLLHAVPDAHRQIVLVMVVEHVIAVQPGGVEIHVAPGHVGKALVDEGGHHLDKFINQAGGGLHHLGGLDIQLGAVAEKGVGIEFGDVHDGLVLPLGPLEHLVLAGVRVGGQVAHVGDVHHPVDPIALVAQELLQYVLHDVGAQVADVGEVVDGGAAGVHFHPAGGVGAELLFFVGSGIVKIHDILSSVL